MRGKKRKMGKKEERGKKKRKGKKKRPFPLLLEGKGKEEKGKGSLLSLPFLSFHFLYFPFLSFVFLFYSVIFFQKGTVKKQKEEFRRAVFLMLLGEKYAINERPDSSDVCTNTAYLFSEQIRAIQF